MTEREEFEKWYKTTKNKGELSRFEIWQARGELDAVRIKELEAELKDADGAAQILANQKVELTAKLDKAKESLQLLRDLDKAKKALQLLRDGEGLLTPIEQILKELDK